MDRRKTLLTPCRREFPEKELFAKPNVDGGLIGGASLAVDKFMPIIEAFDK